MSDEISWGYLGADPVNRVVLDAQVAGHTGHADISFSADGEVDWFGTQRSDIVGEELTPHEQLLTELGWNPFKAVSRAVKKVGRGAKNAVTNPVKFVTRGAQNVAHTASTAARTIAYAAKVSGPYVKYGAMGASIAFPPGAPIAMGVSKAVGTVAKADGKIPKIASASHKKRAAKVRKAARVLVVNTAKAAKAGDKEAKRAMKAIKIVRRARKRAAKKGFKRAWSVSKKGFLLRVL